MMSAVADALLAAGGSPAGSLIVKVTATLVLALAAARLARRSRAAVRHLLLAAAFGALLLVPLVSAVAPSVLVEIPIAAERAAPNAAVDAVIELPAPAPAVVVAPSTSGGSVPDRVSRTWLLLAAWVAGTLLCLLPVVAGLRQLRSLLRTGMPWSRGRSIADRLAVEAGIRRRVVVLLHDAVPGPVTCGLVRPVIVLPADAQTWDDEDLRRAIAHELEHVRRGDWATQCVARAVCGLYWFHPLVWVAWRRLVLEAERACDDAVLGRAEAVDYADQLVLLAERLSTAQHRPLPAMTGGGDLASRVRAVLDSAQARGRAGAARVALTVVLAAVLVAAMAPLRAVAGAQATAALAAEPALAFEVASVRRNTSGQVGQFVRQQPGGRLTIQNMPLRFLVRFAYMVEDSGSRAHPTGSTRNASTSSPRRKRIHSRSPQGPIRCA